MSYEMSDKIYHALKKEADYYINRTLGSADMYYGSGEFRVLDNLQKAKKQDKKKKTSTTCYLQEDVLWSFDTFIGQLENADVTSPQTIRALKHLRKQFVEVVPTHMCEIEDKEESNG